MLVEDQLLRLRLYHLRAFEAFIRVLSLSVVRNHRVAAVRVVGLGDLAEGVVCVVYGVDGGGSGEGVLFFENVAILRELLGTLEVDWRSLILLKVSFITLEGSRFS